MTEGTLDSGSAMRSVEASGTIEITSIRSETLCHKESSGRCLAELTAGPRHEVRWTALEEPRRRKRGSSAEGPWSQVGTDSGIRPVFCLLPVF